MLIILPVSFISCAIILLMVIHGLSFSLTSYSKNYQNMGQLAGSLLSQTGELKKQNLMR